MWDISENALSGQPGIFTHTSVRSDKTDCHPQPELVRMLIELDKEEEQPNIASSAHSGDFNQGGGSSPQSGSESEGGQQPST